jgi:uncharacterized protein (TIGR03083 family)
VTGRSIDHLRHIAAESARFLDVLRGVAPDERVPTCPEWDAADLVWHLADVHWFWGTVLIERLTDNEGYVAPDRPDGYVLLLGFFERARERLLGALVEAGVDAPVWTWSADQTSGFVRRFQAHEAMIHRLDAEYTAGTVTPMDPELSADGIDVVLHTSLGWRPEWADVVADGTTVDVVAHDTGDRWRVATGRWSGMSPNTATAYTDEPLVDVVDDAAGAADATLTGAAAAIDAWLWGRGSRAALEPSGDTVALDRLAAVVTVGVQ